MSTEGLFNEHNNRVEEHVTSGGIVVSSIDLPILVAPYSGRLPDRGDETLVKVDLNGSQTAIRDVVYPSDR